MNKQVFDLPEGTHTIVLGTADINGIMRGKRIPASHWKTICEDGCAIIAAIYAIDMTCDIWDTPYCSFDNGYVDVHIFPLHAPVACPWEPGVALCMAYAEGMDHGPVPIEPRAALAEQLKRASAMGFEIQVGAELEFYLLDPETGLPKDQGIQVYGLQRQAEMEHVLGPIRDGLLGIGIPIEQSNPEYAPGQVEVNIRYAEAMKSADNVILFRNMIKVIAAQHGYLASFMAKPFIDKSGSGFHTHYSLWKDGRNAFSDNGRLNDTGLAFLAGLQKRICGTSIVSSTTPNAYRRRRPYSFCPVNASWGHDNRTVALRVIDGSDKAVRVEKRDAAADCNPYYLMACDIAAGLDGIEQGLRPSEATEGNAYEECADPALPRSLDEAIKAAEADGFVRQTLGDMRYEIILEQSRREVAFVTDQVTDIERERYLANL
ncbi:MAG: glutamine synthetase [Brucellaceae bacterium]|nr:glutamine synthetase [Nitratireductor sp.]MCC0043559.1 glutamine synthetase [Brucellaceae bacterium]